MLPLELPLQAVQGIGAGHFSDTTQGLNFKMNSETKKQVIRDIFEQGWNREDFGSFAAHIAEEVKFNFRGAQQVTNLEELKQLIVFWRNAFPDLKFDVLAVIHEADLVAANLVFSGTHLGDWQGIPPTGRKILVEEMMFFRFSEGKVVELWEVYDEAMLIRQIEKD